MSTSIEGIVLKSFNYGEQHKILNLLTRHHGLVSIFAQNANRTNTKKSALVQPVTCAHFFVRSPNVKTSGLHYLYQGEIINSYLNIKLDYDTMMQVYLMLEIILKGLKSEEISQCKAAYIYLIQALNAIESGAKPSLTSVVFQFKMLNLLGIKPQLDCCTQCSSTSDIVMLSISNGGLVCKRCLNTRETIIIDASFIPLVRALAKVEIESLVEIEVEDELLDEISRFLQSYYESYAGFYLSTKKILNSL